MVSLEVRVKVAEFQERFGLDWSGFRQELLDVYMIYNCITLTKKTFLDWIEKEGNFSEYRITKGI